MNIAPGVYFSRVDFGYLVYDGERLYSIGYVGAKSEVFTVTFLGQEYEIDLLEGKVRRLGKNPEEKNIVELSDSGVSFEPFKL